MALPETNPLALSDAIRSAQHSATRSAAGSSSQDNPKAVGGPFFMAVCVLTQTKLQCFPDILKGPARYVLSSLLSAYQPLKYPKLGRTAPHLTALLIKSDHSVEKQALRKEVQPFQAVEPETNTSNYIKV